MNTLVANGTPMRDQCCRLGEIIADKIVEKFISSLKMFVWCEPPRRK